MLLNYLYPEMSGDWKVLCRGSFYRNYSRDLLSFDPEMGEAELSRDGLIDFLPQGLLNTEEELRGPGAAERHEAVEKRIALLREAFKPIDTAFFRGRLALEKQISQLLENKTEELLKQMFGLDLAAEQNEYVRRAAVLLPLISQLRGDYGFVRRLIATLTRRETEMSFGDYSDDDDTRSFLPEVRYMVICEGLDSREYLKWSAELEPLAAFLGEWLLPFECICRIDVIERNSKSLAGERLVLNYNFRG